MVNESNIDILTKMAIYMGNVLDFPELCIVQEKPVVRYPQLIYQLRERKIDLSRKDFDGLSYVVRDKDIEGQYIGYIAVSQIVTEIALTFNLTDRKARDWFRLFFFELLKKYEVWRKESGFDGMTLHKPVVKS